MQLSIQQIKIIILTLLCLFICIILYIKIPLLKLPFFWDEAWSYSKAVNEMYLHKTTLLSNQVNQEIFRGHPLFFYFITSIFAHITGFNTLSLHTWMLLLSIVFLLFFFKIINSWYGINTTFLATTFFLFQEIFIVQSSFLLPEIIIAFLSVFCFYYYLKNNLILYCIVGCILVLVKESGIVAIIAICLHHIIYAIINKKINGFNFKKLILLSIPILLFILFMLLQKYSWGWFLYPQHIGFIDLYWKDFIYKFKEIFKYIAVADNRKLFFYLLLLSFPFLFLFKKNIFFKIVKDEKIILFLIFGFLYLIFSAINFYSHRYVITVILIYSIILSIVTNNIIKKPFLNICISMLVAFFFLYQYYFQISTNTGDVSKNYYKSVITEKNGIDNFVLKNIDKKYFADFVSTYNLQNYEAGFITKNQKINIVSLHNANYLITTKNEPLDDEIFELKKSNNFVLVYESIDMPAWCRIYQVIPFTHS